MNESQIAPWGLQGWIEEVDHIAATVDLDILAPALRRVGIEPTAEWELGARSLSEERATLLSKDLRTRVAAARFARK